MNEQGKGSLWPIILIMGASLLVAFLWDNLGFIKNTVHYVLDPTAGTLINWNLHFGMIIIVFVITLAATLAQKFATDQNAIRELKKEQKALSEEMKTFRDNPQKMAELSKKQMDFFPRTMKLTSRSMIFTGIPFILFFRWFSDLFTSLNNPKFFGFLNWFWFYFISALFFGTILRKVLKVA